MQVIGDDDDDLLFDYIEGGKNLIDCNNNLDSYSCVIEQLDAALDMIGDRLTASLKEQLLKVISVVPEQRPAVQLLALVGDQQS